MALIPGLLFIALAITLMTGIELFLFENGGLVWVALMGRRGRLLVMSELLGAAAGRRRRHTGDGEGARGASAPRALFPRVPDGTAPAWRASWGCAPSGYLLIAALAVRRRPTVEITGTGSPSPGPSVRG